QMLRVLDPPPQSVALHIVLVEHGGESVERLAIRAVADGVYGYLESIRDADLGELPNSRHFRHLETGVRGLIVVGLEHPCTPRSESPVGADLADGANREVPVAVIHHPARYERVDIVRPDRARAHEDVETQRHVAGVHHP